MSENPRDVMGTERLEAFSDGVLAIIITIMVLELKAPDHPGVDVLWELRWTFISYILSFVYIGIYWNNHHHLLRVTKRVSGSVMWANLHLLFWLSLVPFATAWMGANAFGHLPAHVYGVVMFMAALAFTILQRTIIATDGKDSYVATATGSDFKGKLSLALYLAGMGISFVEGRVAGLIYVIVALIWLVPDRRIERVLAGDGARA